MLSNFPSRTFKIDINLNLKNIVYGLQAGLPDSGIKIISGVLHSHLAGRRMRLRHVRRGVELPTILEDNRKIPNISAIDF